MDDAGHLEKVESNKTVNVEAQTVHGYNFYSLVKANNTHSDKTCRQKRKMIDFPAHLPTSSSSPTRRFRLMAIRMPRTVMPSQKQATTLALGR